MSTKPDRDPVDRPATRRMEIAGQVSIEGTDCGVPGLIVEIHHDGQAPVRLASTVTGQTGRFVVVIQEQDIHPLAITGLFIRLVVMAPERSGLPGAERELLHAAVREYAALHEVFLIEVSKDLLASKGLSRAVASTRPLAEQRAAAIAAAAASAAVISQAANEVAVAKIQAARTRREYFSDVIAPAVRSELSKLTIADRSNPRFVADDTEIASRSERAQREELAKLAHLENLAGQPAAKVRRKTRLQIDATALARLRRDTANGETVVSQEEMEAVLGTSLSKPTSVERSAVAADPCRALLPGEACLNVSATAPQDGTTPPITDDDEATRDPTGTDAHEEGDVAGGNVAFDSGVAIAALMGSQTAPEGVVRFDGTAAGLEPRIGAKGIAHAIGQIVLAPGPADVASFHDFSQLQLAFESVWQEALDDRVLEDVAAAYERIVESGLETDASTAWSLEVVMGFAMAISDATKAVPQAVASHVRISLEEYRALPNDMRGRLDILADQMQANQVAVVAELVPVAAGGGGGGGGDRSWYDVALSLGNSLVGSTIDLALLPGTLLKDLMTGPARTLQHNATALALLEQNRIYGHEASRIVSHARQILIDRERGQPFRPSHEIIERLRRARLNAVPCRHFAASRSRRSVNFGLVTTYRQVWTPVSYQVGDLVSTIPLGPMESRKYTKKVVQKRRRLEKELEANLSNSKFDSETTSRAEAEILAKADGKTSFSNTAKGSFEFGAEGMSAGGESTSTFSADAERHSQDVKRTMRSSVIKAAEERKRETKLEIESELSFESESTEAGELSNPNNEIPVTFLLYELQRRYRINERLHRLQSVVLVAQEMPTAREVDAAWLIQHDWILNRVLLDVSFRPALAAVSNTLVSESVTLDHMRQALLDQASLVEQIAEDLADRRSVAGRRYAALERQIERTARSQDDTGLLGIVSDTISSGGVLGSLLGGGDDGADNAAKIREGAARDAWERERREEEAFRNRLGEAQSTLATMRVAFHDRLSKHLATVTQVERLTVHVWQNIMYYMQAIWSHEPDDQRFLRLRDVPVPQLKPQHRFVVPAGVRVDLLDNMVGVHTEFGLAPPATEPGQAPADLGLAPVLPGNAPPAGTPPAPPERIPTVPLAQVADIGRPMGFMGNYIILPMYESNALTSFMMDPYVAFASGEYGVSDPDPSGNMSLDEFSDYVCCLKESLSDERFAALSPGLNARLRLLLQRSVRANEEIIVGTGNLYIEALPGAHSIMEQFKHLHRQIDVKAAQEELRGTALDNVRRAQRILDKNLDDPDIEAQYLFQGGGSPTVVPPVSGGG